MATRHEVKNISRPTIASFRLVCVRFPATRWGHATETSGAIFEAGMKIITEIHEMLPAAVHLELALLTSAWYISKRPSPQKSFPESCQTQGRSVANTELTIPFCCLNLLNPHKCYVKLWEILTGTLLALKHCFWSACACASSCHWAVCVWTACHRWTIFGGKQ